MREDIKKRLMSKAVWASVIAQILVIVILINPQWGEVFQIVAVALLEIATAFGVLNNPTDKENF